MVSSAGPSMGGLHSAGYGLRGLLATRLMRTARLGVERKGNMVESASREQL